MKRSKIFKSINNKSLPKTLKKPKINKELTAEEAKQLEIKNKKLEEEASENS